MALLIDGYNLLHVTGIVGRPGQGLEGSRQGLLRFLASTLDERERDQTTIVFDAADAPPGLPRRTAFEGITVHFSSNYPDADALIEELIAADHVPRSLVVVSSDHRLQRAARRRRAKYVDSDVWFADAVRRRQRTRQAAPAPRLAKPHVPLTGEEIDYWIAEFNDPALAESDPATSRPASANESPASRDDLANPFPPGYAEDLLE